MRRHLLHLLAAAALTGCGSMHPSPHSGRTYSVVALNSGVTASLRGIAVVNAQTAWASGTGGTVLRTTNGGAAWSVFHVPDADSLDFRDVEAFDSLNAYVLSAGEDGRIYRTTDGGRTWKLQFQNKTKGAFFDCFDFWDAQHGIAMSDPVGGRLLVIATDDGSTWRPLQSAALPVQDGEAAFAASGTCVLTQGQRRVLLATGGGALARVFVSEDRGSTWRVAATPVAAGASSAGIFSLAFRDEQHGIAIGGDYQKPAQQAVIAATSNGGHLWSIGGKTGYVSGAAFVPNTNTVAAVGTPGTRMSFDRGVTWTLIDSVEYNAVQFSADGVGYAVGPKGRIALLRESGQ